MNKKFDRIDAHHPLIQRLAGNVWWEKVLAILKEEKDMNVQMRDRYFNIYYKMYSVAKVFLKKNELVFCIHNEFLREDKKHKKGYTELIVQGPFLTFPQKNNHYQYAIDIFSRNNMRLLKITISRQAGEEKTYQSALVWKNNRTVVDAEVAFNEQLKEVADEMRRSRIDLLNFDRYLNKLVAVELKMVKNRELYDGSIKNQLQKYTDFLSSNKRDLQQAYRKVVKAKIALGLLKKDSFLAKVASENIEIEEKPLLVVICHDQKGIDECRSRIERAVGEVALGVYFFGKNGDLNISKKRHKNKVLFSS